MDKIEYHCNGNELGISIKRPRGIRRKWSEAFIEIQCGECGSTDIRSSTNGAGFAVACMNCPNYDSGMIDRVLTWHDSEETIVNAPKNFDSVK